MDSSPRCGVLFPFVPSQGHRRQKQLEVESGEGDFVSTKKYLTLRKSCGCQSSEREERKTSKAKRGSICTRRGSSKTVTCHGFREVEPVHHEASLCGRFRSWRRASLQGQPCSCLFFKTHQIGFLLRRAADDRRRGSGPGRRAREAV